MFESNLTARGGRVENIVYEDIKMSNVRGAISISCYYPKVPSHDDAQRVTPTTPHYAGIVIRNLSATSTHGAGIIADLPESPIAGVTLENVSIQAAKTGLEIRNSHRVKVKSSKIEPTSGEPYIIRDSEVDVVVGASE